MEKKQKKKILEYKKVKTKTSPPKVNNGKKVKTKTLSPKVNNGKKNNIKKTPKVNKTVNVKNITKENVKIKDRNLDNEYLANFQKEQYRVNNGKDNKIKTKFKKILIITISSIISILVILTLLVIYLPFFKTKNIIVIGNNLANLDEIISLSNITIGESILNSLFNFKEIDVQVIPYIKSVNMKIKNNNTIELNVKERKSVYFAYDKEFNVYYKLDDKGRILEKVDELKYRNDELIVNGITFDKEVVLGSYINEVDLNKLNNAKLIEKEIINNIKDSTISKLILENELYKFKINDKLEVIFDKLEDIEYNVNFLNSMIPQIGITEGSVDFTKENPVFIRYN